MMKRQDRVNCRKRGCEKKEQGKKKKLCKVTPPTISLLRTEMNLNNMQSLFYHPLKHGSFITKKACIYQDIP